MTDRMLGLGFAALGLIILVLSLQLPAPMAATRIAYGPGFFPTILAVAIAASGLVMFASRAEPADPEDEVEETGGNHYLRPAIVAGAALAYIFFSQQLGFLLLAPVMMFGLLIMGRVSVVKALPISLIGSVIIYFLFAKLLLVPLPLGLLRPFGGFL